ncbi:MAG: acetyltransferase [Actinomycetia bacterium]|nr:acetyltransferase [Actinomycetes bacterium]
MTARTLRWQGGWARLSAWRGLEHVAYLAVGADAPPPREVVGQCLERMREDGFEDVVTSAMSPADSLAFVDAGFAVRERLYLLRHDMENILPMSPRPLTRGRRVDHAAVLELDELAFDGFWHFDATTLEDALRATPSTRFRLGGDDHGLRTYAISGRAGRQGYLQRLAVHPDARREGWGRVMVADALWWLRRRGVDRTLVNTQLHNEGALRLYEECGFRRLPFGLNVLGRAL